MNIVKPTEQILADSQEVIRTVNKYALKIVFSYIAIMIVLYVATLIEGSFCDNNGGVIHGCLSLSGIVFGFFSYPFPPAIYEFFYDIRGGNDLLQPIASIVGFPLNSLLIYFVVKFFTVANAKKRIQKLSEPENPATQP